MKKKSARTVDTVIPPTKVSDETMARIEKKVERYCPGNRSAWLRHAAANYTPERGEKISRKP